MIQRIQSVYLFVVTVLLVLSMCFPIGHFIGADGVTEVFKPLGVVLADGSVTSTWGLFCILLLSAVVALGNASFQVGWALCLPAISIILNYLAFRAIYRDEVMVRAADRLR